MNATKISVISGLKQAHIVFPVELMDGNMLQLQRPEPGLKLEL